MNDKVGVLRLLNCSEKPRKRSHFLAATSFPRRGALAVCALSAVFLAACGGGGDGNSGSTVALGGLLSGLSPGAQLTIQNGLATAVLSTNGRYSLAAVSYGASYNVRVVTQPVGETCTVSQGTGTASGPVTNANIVCTRNVAKFAYVLSNLGTGVNGTVTAYIVSAGVLSSPVAIATGVHPVAMAVNPAGTYLYVVNDPLSGNGTISVYQINRSTGVLTDVTQGSPANSGTTPSAIAIDPSGSYLYVTDTTGPVIRAYAISGNTLTATGTPQATGNNPSEVAVAPSGNFVYVTNYGDNSVSAYSLSRVNGALTPDSAGSVIGLVNQNPASIAVGPAGNALYTANSGDFSVASLSVNTSTGALSNLNNQTAGTGSGSLAVDPNGRFLLVANGSANTVGFYTVNASTGALSSSLNNTSLAGSVDSQANVTLDPTGAYAYVTDQTDSKVYAYSVDSTLGALNSLTPASISAATPVAVVLTP